MIHVRAILNLLAVRHPSFLVYIARINSFFLLLNIKVSRSWQFAPKFWWWVPVFYGSMPIFFELFNCWQEGWNIFAQLYSNFLVKASVINVQLGSKNESCPRMIVFTERFLRIGKCFKFTVRFNWDLVSDDIWQYGEFAVTTRTYSRKFPHQNNEYNQGYESINIFERKRIEMGPNNLNGLWRQ